MTPADLKAARKRLGLTQRGLAEALRLQGADPARTVRSWEKGERPITGPVQVAVRLLYLDSLSKEMGELVEDHAAAMHEAMRSSNFEKVNAIQAKIGDLHDRLKRARHDFNTALMWRSG